MAITQTGAIYKSLSFDNTSSRSYGVYITGQAVYNAPQRAVEMITIPGRNGAFALDQGRFENIEVSYPAGIFADNEADFAQAVSDFRNFLCSKKGYCRLTDEYNPNEYRMAVYKSGLDVSPAQLRAGEFDITFECKPQRWLTDGETPVEIGTWGDTDTETGSIVEIDNPDNILAIKDLQADIVAVQSGSGTPSPDNVRPISGFTEVKVYVSPTIQQADATVYTIDLDGTRYGGTLDVTSGVLTVTHRFLTIDGTETYWFAVGNEYPQIYNVAFYDLTTKGVHETTDIVSNMGFVPTAYVYSTMNNYDYAVCIRANEDANGRWRVYLKTENSTLAALKTWLGSNPLQIVYPLATPLTVNLTAQEIELLQGANNVWADSGDVTVEYGNDPNKLMNPTLFDAEPLLAIKGYGKIGFNGYEIELENTTLGRLVLASGESNVNVSGASYTISIDPALLDTGDSITLSSLETTWRFRSTVSGHPISSATLSSNTGITGSSATCQYGSPTTTVVIALPDLELAKGTSVTYTNTTVASGNIKAAGTYSAQCVWTVSYNGNQTISVSYAFTYSNVNTYSTALSYGEITGESTKSLLGNPTYIDCELGDAYRIESGQYVSLNASVDLGSDLPKLAPGSNTVTFDNTVTELKITPRWWKV